jgi:hypothetical protein
MHLTNLRPSLSFACTLLAISAAGACSGNDALLGGGDAGPKSQGGGAGVASSSTGGGAGATGGGASGTGGAGTGGCPMISKPNPASCPTNPSAVEGAWCPMQGASCAVCSPGVACCRQFLLCLPSGCAPPSNCPSCRFRWQQLEAGPCAQDGGGVESSSDSGAMDGGATDGADRSDANAFACGLHNCSESEFCLEDLADMRGNGHGYFCAPLPSRCPSLATCTCVVPYSNDAGAFSATNNICTSSSGVSFAGCVDEGSGHVRVQCQLPTPP